VTVEAPAATPSPLEAIYAAERALRERGSAARAAAEEAVNAARRETDARVVHAREGVDAEARSGLRAELDRARAEAERIREEGERRAEAVRAAAAPRIDALVSTCTTLVLTGEEDGC